MIFSPVNWMRGVGNWLRGLLAGKQRAAKARSGRRDVNALLREGHSCGPVALARVMPDLSDGQIIKAFNLCCEEWPYGGVSNKEFNITLRHLKIFDRFEYDDRDGMTAGDFTARKRDTFIILIYGHYTVVENGEIRDSYSDYCAYSDNEDVYCSWRSISGLAGK